MTGPPNRPTLGELYRGFLGADAALRGVGAAAGGLVLATGLRMARSIGRTPRVLVFLVIAFVAVAVLRWPLVPVLLGLAPVSVLAAWLGFLAPAWRGRA